MRIIFDFRILYDDPDFRYTLCRTTREVKELISALLEKDPTERLGHNGAEEVKSHDFFIGTNWTKVMTRSITPSFVPCLSSSEDVSNFDTEFTSDSIRLSFNSKSSIKYSHVNSFSYGLA